MEVCISQLSSAKRKWLLVELIKCIPLTAIAIVVAYLAVVAAAESFTGKAWTTGGGNVVSGGMLRFVAVTAGFFAGYSPYLSTTALNSTKGGGGVSILWLQYQPSSTPGPSYGETRVILHVHTRDTYTHLPSRTAGDGKAMGGD